MSKDSKSRVTDKKRFERNFDAIEWDSTKNRHYTMQITDDVSCEVTQTPFFPNADLQKVLSGQEPVPDRKTARWPGEVKTGPE